MRSNPSEPPRNPWALALGAGTELVVSVLLGVVAGRWADDRLGTSPWLALVGTFAGIAVGLYQLIKKVSPPPSGRA